MAVDFAQKFTELLGKFVYCADEHELIEHLNALFMAKGWNKIYSKEIVWRDQMLALKFAPVTTDDLADCECM